MMKVVPVMAFYFLIISACAGQVKPVEYRDTVFSSVRVEPDLAYRSPLPAGKAGKGYHFDMYEPGEGAVTEPGVPVAPGSANLRDSGTDTLPAGLPGTSRPLIIWMHGGRIQIRFQEGGGAPFLVYRFCPARLFVCVH
jgi:hypothetical protein